MSLARQAKLLKSFRERFVTLHPVIVRRVELGADLWGDTGLVKRKGVTCLMVRIGKDLSPDTQIFVLVHELAHCVQWRSNEDGRESDHDAEWGVAYARIWQTLFGE